VSGFTPADGYTGLITGKKAAVIYTSGIYWKPCLLRLRTRERTSGHQWTPHRLAGAGVLGGIVNWIDRTARRRKE